MIHTDIDIKDLFYGWIDGSPLREAVGGRLYKDARPLNSAAEDIVISVLARDAGQTQEAVVNVNVYVPDVRRDKEFIEGTPRLRELCTIAAGLLEYRNFGHAVASLQSQEVFKANDIDFHCINNRIRIRFNNETPE